MTEHRQPLKPYWIKPGISRVWLVQDLQDPWNDETNWQFDPTEFKRKHPGACFFSNLKRSPKEGFWVKVWLYNFKVRKNFQNAGDRYVFVFWVNPNWLDEIPL